MNETITLYLNKMKRIAQQLFDFLEAKEHVRITTPCGITISVDDDISLLAEFTLLKLEDASLELSFSREKKGFVKALNIRQVRDIYALTPGRLMELYYEGLADIACWVDLTYSYALSFRKAGNIIVAENDRTVKHEIPASRAPQTPEQFIAYTKRYYRLLEVQEN